MLKDKAAVEELQWTIVSATEKYTRDKSNGKCFRFANLLVKISDLQALCWGKSIAAYLLDFTLFSSLGYLGIRKDTFRQTAFHFLTPLP